MQKKGSEVSEKCRVLHPNFKSFFSFYKKYFSSSRERIHNMLPNHETMTNFGISLSKQQLRQKMYSFPQWKPIALNSVAQVKVHNWQKYNNKPTNPALAIFLVMKHG